MESARQPARKPANRKTTPKATAPVDVCISHAQHLAKLVHADPLQSRIESVMGDSDWPEVLTPHANSCMRPAPELKTSGLGAMNIYQR